MNFLKPQGRMSFLFNVRADDLIENVSEHFYIQMICHHCEYEPVTKTQDILETLNVFVGDTRSKIDDE